MIRFGAIVPLEMTRPSKSSTQTLTGLDIVNVWIDRVSNITAP